MYPVARRVFTSSLFVFKHTIRPAATSKFDSLNRMAAKTAQVDEWKINYEQIGNGNQAVFLIPGALGSMRTDFAPQLEKLNSRQLMTIIGWDPPGYGYSRPPDRTFPLDFLKRDADVAAKLLQEVLHLKDVAVVGWSDGGIVGLILAADYPELVKKLVVFGANAFVSDDDLRAYEAVRDVQVWSPKMREAMEELYGAEYFKVTWSNWVDAMKAVYDKKEGNICKEKVSKIKCPTLLLHGKKDPMVPQFHTDFLRKNIKNIKYFEYENGKHNLHQKFADEFNQQVETFILNDDS